MDDLLKEAIADAKAVRETALENAKIALEEAFTPRLQSMLSKKIQSEMDVEEQDDEMEDEEAYGEDDGNCGAGQLFANLQDRRILANVTRVIRKLVPWLCASHKKRAGHGDGLLRCL